MYDAKEDLTNYSDAELSLRVFNDEFLYNHRHRLGFIELLDECFIYTPSQLEALQYDLIEDGNE